MGEVAASVGLAVIFSLALPSIVFAYIAFQLREEHWPMKLFLTGTSLAMLLGVPFTGMKLAVSAGYTGISSYLNYFQLAVIVVFIIFVFYMIWMYIKDTGKIISGFSQEAGTDQGL